MAIWFALRYWTLPALGRVAQEVADDVAYEVAHEVAHEAAAGKSS